MLNLKSGLAAELPAINTALARHVAELSPIARPVAEHVLGAGGKRLRPFLTRIAGRAFGCDSENLYTLGAAVEMLHAATLLHDDILDNSALRRDKATAHILFGIPQVIMAGHALLAKSLLMVARLGGAAMTACISEAVMHTAAGEMEEFAELRNIDLPYARYLEIITGKTAWMLRASCELGALAAGAPSAGVAAASAFGLELGIAFQMVDDALDFSPSSLTGKPSGGDVREGKATPPLLFYLKSLPEDEANDLRAAFRAGPLDEKRAAAVCAAVHEGGFAARARELAEDHLRKAVTALDSFPPSPERELLARMPEYVRNRDR